MTDLVHYEPTDSWVPMLGAVGDLASKVAGTSFVPKSMRREPASVAAAILLGREMGLGPMASLRGIDVIEGKPALTAQMLAARILAAGHRIEWTDSTDLKCTVRITRADGLSQAELTWTKADAERAGLWGKGAWRGYPRHMLRHRALSEAAGMACPDVALGLDVGDAPDDGGPRPAGGTTVRLAPAQTDTTPPTDAITSHNGVISVHNDAMHDAADVHGAPRTPQPEPEPDLITPGQMRKLQASLADLDRLEGRKLGRDERRQMIAGLAGVEHLASAKDLTKEQATTAIDALQGMLDAAADVIDAEVGE